MDKQTTRHLRSWQRRKQARPGEILEAALAVFAEKGFAAARMEDIALKAGVTKGTIYLYFPSKEEVFKQLAREHVGAALGAGIEQARNHQGSAREFLALFFTIVGGLIQRSEGAVLPKIIIGESGNFPELARFWHDEVIEKAMSMLSGVIERGIAKGELRPIMPEYAVRTIMSAILMSLIWRTVFAPFEPEPLDIPKFLAFHLDVVMRGLAPEGQTP
jgi:AcrR family transcriptional regulator